MNQIVNKFSLAGDKFMPEMHLGQPGFVYSACGIFTRNKERIQTFMQKGNTNYIYKNELDKACFQHDKSYGKYKNLERRTQSNKVLKDKAFEIANNPKYDGYQRGLASMADKLFDEKSKAAGFSISFLVRNQKELVLNLSQINSYLINSINQLLENLLKEKCIHLLKIIFGVLI